MRTYLGDGDPGRRGTERNVEEPDYPVEPCTLEVPPEICRRGVEMKLVVADGPMPSAAPDSKLLGSIANAHRRFLELKSGEAKSVHDPAARQGVHWANVSRTLPLAFLAPEIVEAILIGRQPVDLTVTRRRRMQNLPASWARHRQLLGFR